MNTWRMAPPTTAPFTASDYTVPQALNTVQTVTPIVQPALSQYPCTIGGTVFYNNQAQVSTQQLSQVPSYPHSALAYPTSFIPQPHNFASTSVQPPPNVVTLEDLKEVLTFNRKDPLPPWNLRKYYGCPLQWFEWIGQFRSAVDSENLSDDVKLHYLKSLVKDKAETAMAEFAYSGTMYKVALMKLERKFGQPQIIIRAYLDKLYNSPPVKMHSSVSIISFASMIASIVGVFKSLHYNADLESATLLDKAIEKLPPNMKESWSFHTVKRSLYAPSLIDFNHWLEDKAEALERMHLSSNFNRNQDNSVRTKTNVKMFAANSQAKFDANIQYSPCLVCKGKHSIFKYSVFKKKLQHSVLNCALKISFAFLVFKEITCLGNVPSPILVLNHSARALIMCYCTAQNAFSLQITNLVMHRTQLQPIPQFKLHLDPRRKTILVGHHL